MRISDFNGLKTLFYDGSVQLRNETLEDEWIEYTESGEIGGTADCLEVGDWDEWPISKECKEYMNTKLSIQQIVVEDGVREIPFRLFENFYYVQYVAMADSVLRMGAKCISGCIRLEEIELSCNLEYIGDSALYGCNLYCIFVPHNCREIGEYAFAVNTELSILVVPQGCRIGNDVIQWTQLAINSPFPTTEEKWLYHTSRGEYDSALNDQMNNWIKNTNYDDVYALHRACASYQPSFEEIQAIIQEKGLIAFREENSTGITPSEYLHWNPYSNHIFENEIIKAYMSKMMGESL